MQSKSAICSDTLLDPPYERSSFIKLLIVENENEKAKFPHTGQGTAQDPCPGFEIRKVDNHPDAMSTMTSSPTSYCYN